MATQQMLLGQGGSGPIYATWNPSDKAASISLSGGNLIATGTTFGGDLLRATKFITGKMYYEGSFVPNADGVGFGLAPASDSLNQWVGGANGYGHFLPSNDVYNLGGVLWAGATRSVSPVTVGIAVDGIKVWIRVTGQPGWEGGGDPAAGTSPTFTMLAGTAGTYKPCATPYTAGAGAVTLNCGQSAFALWTPSGGFAGVS